MASLETQASLALRRANVAFELHAYELDASEATYGESVAATLGVAPARLLKTLVAEVDGRPVIAVVPTSTTLVLKALAQAAQGKRAVMADPQDAERWTGYVTGGISPFGQKRRLPTFVDASATGHDKVLVSGGRRGLQLELEPSDLLACTGGTLVEGLGRQR